MGIWLGMDGATSDPIEELEPFHASLLAFNQPSNIPGTQQSQVYSVGGMKSSSQPLRIQTRSLGALQRKSTASLRGGVKTITTTSIRGGSQTRAAPFIPQE
ncbi:hypothetical protein Tco_0835398 [Tanacetum coccineum]